MIRGTWRRVGALIPTFDPAAMTVAAATTRRPPLKSSIDQPRTQRCIVGKSAREHEGDLSELLRVT